MRVAIDATPLLGRRTGIGTYVAHLIAELAGLPELELRAAAFSMRSRSALRELPAPVRPVHRPVPARLLNRAWLRGDLPWAELVTGRTDVVHGTNFVLPPPRRAAGVVTVHDLTFLRYPQLLDGASQAFRELTPRAIARADLVLTPTRAVADEVGALGPRRTAVTPLGVGPEWFAPPLARPPGLPSEYVLALGTLEPRKGLDVLLDAYRRLPDAPPLVLAGAAGWGPALSSAGLAPERVIRLGYVEDPVALVAGASLLAFPSRYEGFGLPPLEALATGTAVVVSDLPATREVLGQHARYVSPQDADALADAIAEVLADPPDPAPGREHARGFTWARTAALTLAAYRSVG